MWLTNSGPSNLGTANAPTLGLFLEDVRVLSICNKEEETLALCYAKQVTRV